MSFDINRPWASAISEGVKQGVDRHWRYSKEMLKVKPEYLLTVFVAEQLANGAGAQSGYDLSIKLEEPTYRIVGDLLLNQVGYARYFKERMPWPGRKGWVDIYVEHEINKEARIVELKNFDPSSTELSKEFMRFVHFLEINDYENTLAGCYLAFPTCADRKAWIEKWAYQLSNSRLRIAVDSTYEITGTDPEDGIPAYYRNVVSFEKVDVWQQIGDAV
jgi:hypothetical protein